MEFRIIQTQVKYFLLDVAKDYFGAKIGTGLINNAYTRIRECNNLLEDIDVKGASLDKTFRDRAKGKCIICALFSILI